MDRARIHEGIDRMRFTDVPGRSELSELSQMEAAELLGISERTFRRWRDRHRDTGLAGLADRRLAPSLRRAPLAEIERMLGLYRDLYRGFTAKHFHEQLGKRHNYTLAPGLNPIGVKIAVTSADTPAFFRVGSCQCRLITPRTCLSRSKLGCGTMA
jgi:hypothetical protein